MKFLTDVAIWNRIQDELFFHTDLDDIIRILGSDDIDTKKVKRILNQKHNQGRIFVDHDERFYDKYDYDILQEIKRKLFLSGDNILEWVDDICILKIKFVELVLTESGRISDESFTYFHDLSEYIGDRYIRKLNRDGDIEVSNTGGTRLCMEYFTEYSKSGVSP